MADECAFRALSIYGDDVAESQAAVKVQGCAWACDAYGGCQLGRIRDIVDVVHKVLYVNLEDDS
jgi:hypothetical protein